MSIAARSRRDALADPKSLKDPDPTRPIDEWLKIAVYRRLRPPRTLYDRRRKFLIVDPAGTEKRLPHAFPRKLGRRMDYDRPPGGRSDKGKFYAFPGMADHPGYLRDYHGLRDAGSLCGGPKSPPTSGPPGSSLSAAEITRLGRLDDMYWPATFADMPMLRELAYTPDQHDQFKAWQGPDADVRIENIFDIVVSPGLAASFAGPGDADDHFDALLAARPLYAPAMIDMAHLGAMLGGSFLPGIEVGREAGIAANWSIFHGASRFFPCLRFKPANRTAEHTPGTLTKDLAVPWTVDFAACDETFWPTSRPGMTTKDGIARHEWMIGSAASLPHLGRPAAGIEFIKEYWKALGFVRRRADDALVETEQSWH